MIYGHGDLELLPSYAEKHRVSVDTWTSMSSTECHKAADAGYKLLATEKTLTSTDGILTVLTSGAGKKPHQRKRKRAEKDNNCEVIKASHVCAKRRRF